MNEITLMNNSTNNSTTLASIYITNLAKYNDGELVFKASNLKEHRGFLPYEISKQLEQHVDFTSIAEEWINGVGY